jgi:kynurenine formamidase
VVGLDTPSLDYGKSTTFPAHQILGKANILGFENIFNLKNLTGKKFRIMVLPMKIAGGSVAPLRIIPESEK